ncbi:MAG: biotin--[acetyl-CoA-carboxylase] ligase [Rhodobacteraceae bacterium]|nr:MAG: biotin--[acetyl-CoA-carboxylase] ligase [Paracoccaceae bacterium]
MSDWPEGYGLRVLEEVDSTLDEARRIAGGLGGPEWILARRQTAARGRRGRAWVAPEGNLFATLVMRPPGPASGVALRSFVSALALVDALAEVAGGAQDLALKWPNDVLLNGGKVAGILLESVGSGVGVSHLAIGIGVNLAHAPDPGAVEAGAVRPVSLKGETGIEIAPRAFLDHLARAYDRHERTFRAYGFAPIRAAWMARAARLGEEVTARTAKAETRGIFQTVDDAGNLVLKTPQGRVAIPAADIYF